MVQVKGCTGKAVAAAETKGSGQGRSTGGGRWLPAWGSLAAVLGPQPLGSQPL